MDLINTKICNKCEVKKPKTTEFFNLLSSGHWRGTCKVCMAAATRKHHAENPGMTAARRESYNKRRREAQGAYSDGEARQLREHQKNCCAYCGDLLNKNAELDHKIPLLRGGTNFITNIAWTCRTCNRDKGSKTAYEFFVWRKKLGMKTNPNVRYVKRKAPAKDDSSSS